MRIRLLFLFIVFLPLLGCSSDEDLRQYIQDIKSRPSKSIEPIPTFEPPPKFLYPEEEKRRSPFKPIPVPQEVDRFAPNINRPKQPLEAFPLDALKFVGILKEGSSIWGLIRQPNGMVARVKSGDYMGKNFGQIIRITNETIELEETVQIGGKWEKKRISLKLFTPEMEASTPGTAAHR